MVKVRFKRFGLIVFSLLFFICAAFSLFLPFPKDAGAVGESYFCRWEDGRVSNETYASAYPDYFNSSCNSIFLCRGGIYGEIQTSKQFQTVYRTLFTGGLAELLSLSGNGISRLERLAVWRSTNGWIWYSSGYFVWNEGLTETASAKGEKLILLSGRISALRLNKTGAKHLELRSEAEFDVKTIYGTKVEKITANAPYAERGGAVYLDTGTAVRLTAALPPVTSLTVSGNDYADEGALLAAQNLQSLTLPFAGNAPVKSNYFRGEIAYLFSDGTDYVVPVSLKRVKITGGLLVSHAFYRMSMVEEIDLCGMLAENIENNALADVLSW